MARSRRARLAESINGYAILFQGWPNARIAAGHRDLGKRMSGGWARRPLVALIALGFFFRRQWQAQCISGARVRQRKAPSTDKPMLRIKIIGSKAPKSSRSSDPARPTLAVDQTAGRRGWRLFEVLAVATIALSAPVRVAAADLKPQTIQAWEAYIEAAQARNHQHLTEGGSFLSIDGESARLRQGDVIVSPARPNVPVKVPSGLIHDWTGAMFIPNASMGDVMRVVRDYNRYQTIYHPNVVGSKPIESDECEDRFSMVIMNKSFFARSALDSDYRSTFTRIDDEHWYSTSQTTRVQEVADYGAASQHLLPEDHGTGIIWRLYSFARYQQRDGGVYIELEAIALSRDIPASLRWVVDPIVRRVSRSSLATSLQQTADAVRNSANVASRSTERPRRDHDAGPVLKSALSPAGSQSFR